MIRANEGQMIYSGVIGAYKVANLLDITNIGIVHSGIGGGEIFGYACTGLNKGDNSLKKYVDSLNLDGKQAEIFLSTIKEKYDNFNQFIMLNDIRRYMNLCKSTSRRFIMMSPFLYEPFFEYVLQIDFKEKMERKLYRKWYLEKIHFDVQATSALTGFKNRIFDAFYRNKRNLIKESLLVFRKLNIKSYYDMNPFQYWYDNNKDLQEFLWTCEKKDIWNLK